MATIISTVSATRTGTRLPSSLFRLLPSRLCEEIEAGRWGSGRIEELRLRTERCAFLTTDRGSVRLSTVVTRREIDDVVLGLCDGSLYAHRDCIAEGYLTLPDGLRVGICGRASVEGGRVLGVYDISALNFRFPTHRRGLGAPVVRLLRTMTRGEGVLVYAPPGEGKTTLLRSVAEEMASGNDPWRVCVIDTRGELGAYLGASELSIDLLSGYPRALGIEIATRTMNAELILCDEIGEMKEAEAILSAQNCGVPFVASTHAEDVSGLLRRDGLRRLHEARVFGAYVGIRRRRGANDFLYTVTDWESADHDLQICGSADSLA
ncbi:MAG: AAA family ATPase [Clostridia bacterium]|nr:AAA family ATPase [Clostridia bacterium]